MSSSQAALGDADEAQFSRRPPAVEDGQRGRLQPGRWHGGLRLQKLTSFRNRGQRAQMLRQRHSHPWVGLLKRHWQPSRHRGSIPRNTEREEGSATAPSTPEGLPSRSRSRNALPGPALSSIGCQGLVLGSLRPDTQGDSDRTIRYDEESRRRRGISVFNATTGASVWGPTWALSGGFSDLNR